MLRLLQIFILTIKYSFLLIASKLHLKKTSKPKLLRKFFEDASGAFIKFGQLLALRVDMVSKEYNLELLNLLDNVPSFSYKQVEEIFLSELGATPDKIFGDFQKAPFASASFGQVHGARLKDGGIVAVKVLRPGIENKVQIDFLIIDFLAFLADAFFKIEALPWKEFASEFKNWTRQELNYQFEAEHGERFFQNNQGNPNVVIPKIYHQFTTRRILVEEYVEGLHLNRLLKKINEGQLHEKDLKEMNVDLKKVPRVLVEELLRQLLIYGFFHADPHPGNIILLPNGKIALIDFGIVGGKSPLPKSDWLVKYLKATGNMQFKEACYGMAHFSNDEVRTLIYSALPATIKLNEVEKILDKLADALAETFSEEVKRTIINNNDNFKQMKTDYMLVFLQILKNSRRYRTRLPKQIVVFFRTLSVIGLLAKQMDKEFYVTVEMKKFFEKYSDDQFIKEEAAPVRRISREVALERLQNWFSYLIENDQATFLLVKSQLDRYNFIER